MSSLMYFILTSANVLGVIALFILTAAYVSVHPYETLSTHFSIKTFTVFPTYCSRYSCSDSLPTAISSPALRLFSAQSKEKEPVCAADRLFSIQIIAYRTPVVLLDDTNDY